MKKIGGIIVAMVTPMDDFQNISYIKTKKLLDYLLSFDIQGIFILGTNGESYVLTEEEKYYFSEFVIKYVNKQVQVFVGAGLDSTRDTIKFSKEISLIGADALSIVAPSFVAPSQSEVISHYEKIADSVNVPILIYNMPSKTGINMNPETVEKLSKHPNIIGIKDSSGNLENTKGYIRLCNSDTFSVLSGSDSKILDVLQIGGDGAIAATANLLTNNDVNIYKSFKNGNIEKAKKYQDNIEPLRKLLHKGTTPTMLKLILNSFGLDVGSARFPAIMDESESMLIQVKEMIEYYKHIGVI
ncbi:4-hydroxy-tetrahydrodipicolinate synthase [Ligilactobacillus sp. WILCCON 0076]|uniref:4-hydroxy-tetrahydrodipicolinate synthase n=1 Tax=Ligilactobacillus ubinensis TaxID=2876789 RepID=A0A9X2JMP4_9LACO|nr:4-hydroxy-tetrahydrodipicolinate synthase [Ligilactobacillus ubinensis]MCP0888014.1 4-hydroxy-tetrahydrodipicolinate synthase [Ligilactobacillus ubinensis]